MQPVRSLFSAICVLGMVASGARGQVVLDNFDPNANDTVRTITVQGDGKVVIGGDFTIVGGTNRSHIARLNEDGKVDSTFNASASRSGSSYRVVNALVIQPDGKILVAGNFTTFNGQSRSNVVRLNTDGNLDSTFNANSNAFPGYAMALQPDGKILVVGPSQNGISRLNTNGTIDSTFTPISKNPYCVALQADGRILIGGSSLMQVSPYSGILRLAANGTNDPSFHSSSSDAFIEYSGIFQVAVQPDQKILVSGWFTQLGGQYRGGFGRLNTNGSLDTSFVPPTARVDSFVLQPDGRIVAAGQLVDTDGVSRQLIGRINADGRRDTNFQWVVASGFESIALQPGGKILVGGSFGSFNGVPRGHIARLYSLPDPATPRPEMRPFVHVGGGVFRFNVTELGQTNLPMTVLVSSDLTSPSETWTSVGPLQIGPAGNYFEFTDPAATNLSQRFYQLRF